MAEDFGTWECSGLSYILGEITEHNIGLTGWRQDSKPGSQLKSTAMV